MNLRNRIMENKKETIFGVPFLYPSMNIIFDPDCRYLKTHRRYHTDYCTRPEHVALFVSDGRGIVGGCQTCPLYLDKIKKLEEL